MTTTGTGGSGTTGGASLKILFSPMYSAFDGVHDFKIPAVVNGVDNLDWTASDPSMVDIEPDDATGGAMITMRKAGVVTITASAGNLTGTSKLTILQATPEQWQAGSDRYHDGVVLRNVSGALRDGGMEAACTNCHGSTATALDVQHTPQQTGGYSDQDILNIVTMGIKPAGVGQRILPYDQWHAIHHWDLPADPLSIVVYLRSLTPTAQGPVDFGGGFVTPVGMARDGGGGFMRGDGGGNNNRREGGAPPPRRDGGGVVDAGAGADPGADASSTD